MSGERERDESIDAMLVAEALIATAQEQGTVGTRFMHGMVLASLDMTPAHALVLVLLGLIAQIDPDTALAGLDQMVDGGSMIWETER